MGKKNKLSYYRISFPIISMLNIIRNGLLGKEAKHYGNYFIMIRLKWPQDGSIIKMPLKKYLLTGHEFCTQVLRNLKFVCFLTVAHLAYFFKYNTANFSVPHLGMQYVNFLIGTKMKLIWDVTFQWTCLHLTYILYLSAVPALSPPPQLHPCKPAGVEIDRNPVLPPFRMQYSILIKLNPLPALKNRVSRGAESK